MNLKLAYMLYTCAQNWKFVDMSASPLRSQGKDISDLSLIFKSSRVRQGPRYEVKL